MGIGSSGADMRIRRIIGSAAFMAVLVALPAWAGHKTIDTSNLKKQLDLPPGVYGESFDVRLVVQQVYNPGMSDKRGCRLQVFFENQAKAKINLRVLINTYDTKAALLDTNLVPSGELDGGQQVMRLLSCSPAQMVEVSRESSYGWPQVCDIDGVEQSPCPIAVHFSSTMGIVEAK